MIEVKLIALGSPIVPYALENRSDVSSLFRAAGKSFVQGNVTRNQETVSEDTILHDGDRIFLGQAVKGNIPFEVSFLRLGDASISLPAEDGYTIKATLSQLGDDEKAKFYRADGKASYEFRIGNSAAISEDTVLQRPDSGTLRVICSQRVKGNK